MMMCLILLQPFSHLCNSKLLLMYLYPQWERLHLWSNIVPPEHLLLCTRKPPNWYGSRHSLLGSFTFIGAIEAVLDEPPHLWSCNDVNQPNSIGWWPCKVSLIHWLRMLNGNFVHCLQARKQSRANGPFKIKITLMTVCKGFHPNCRSWLFRDIFTSSQIQSYYDNLFYVSRWRYTVNACPLIIHYLQNAFIQQFHSLWILWWAKNDQLKLDLPLIDHQ